VTAIFRSPAKDGSIAAAIDRSEREGMMYGICEPRPRVANACSELAPQARMTHHGLSFTFAWRGVPIAAARTLFDQEGASGIDVFYEHEK
jgi:hypothetical protein